jgi:hypothetical protein
LRYHRELLVRGSSETQKKVLMKSKSPRARVTLSPSIDQRLTSYALAASAAGVGVLALTMPAEGRIIYTPAHHVITHGGSFSLDVNHDGVIDFTLRDRSFTRSMSTFISMLSAIPAAGNGIDGWTAVQRGLSNTQMQHYAFALKAGVRIGGAQYFVGQKIASVSAGPGGGYYDGSWVNVKNRYLGLQFKINGAVHYGWARLNVQVQNQRVTGTLTGYAYETLADKSIVVGQTAPDSTAEASSLGSLAKGWSALPGASAK